MTTGAEALRLQVSQFFTHAQVADVVSDAYRVRWMGRQAVIALPEHINVSNAGQIREELLWVINRGAITLIADMTATVSCDHSGAAAVAAGRQADGAASGSPLSSTPPHAATAAAPRRPA